ncbi:hypothetical protein TWF481_003106 [Arthrobotrys musiformis]|uniref:Uncharacterized protein n=1 Tax=Arthrobotrys musiformis TaxID=47236 RepID=A0AAV9VRF8_9PEZI
MRFESAWAPVRKPTHDFIVPLEKWREYEISIRPKLRKLGEEIDFFGEVRKSICPLDRIPMIDGELDWYGVDTPDRESLAWLLRGLRHAASELDKFVNVLKHSEKNPQDDNITIRRNKAMIIKEFSLPPDLPDAINHAETVLNVLKKLYVIGSRFALFYGEIEQYLSEPGVPQPIDYSKYTNKEAQMLRSHREPVLLDWATTTLVGLGPNNDQTTRRVSVDVVSQRDRLIEIGEQLSALVKVSESLYFPRDIAMAVGLYSPSWSTLLTPTVDYDTDYFERPTPPVDEKPYFGFQELLGALEAWYGCWQTPYFNVLKAMTDIPLFPGVEGGFDQKLMEDPLSIDDNAYVTELLKLALQGAVVSKEFPSADGGNIGTPVIPNDMILENEGDGGVEFEDYYFEKDVQEYTRQNREGVAPVRGRGAVNEGRIEEAISKSASNDMEEELDQDFSPKEVEIYISEDEVISADGNSDIVASASIDQGGRVAGN